MHGTYVLGDELMVISVWWCAMKLLVMQLLGLGHTPQGTPKLDLAG